MDNTSFYCEECSEATLFSFETCEVCKGFFCKCTQCKLYNMKLPDTVEDLSPVCQMRC